MHATHFINFYVYNHKSSLINRIEHNYLQRIQHDPLSIQISPLGSITEHNIGGGIGEVESFHQFLPRENLLRWKSDSLSVIADGI